MKLLTMVAEDRSHHLGVLIPGTKKIIDLFLYQASPLHQNMIEFIKTQDHTLLEVDKVLEKYRAGSLPENCILEEDSALLAAPLPHPLSCRDAYAFRQHVENARRGRGLPMIDTFDHFPVFYFTNHLAITGPGEIYVMEKALENLDFELEVAIVIGKEGRNIPAHQADEYIFGYLIMNDWSARAFQSEEMKLNLGPAKGKDFATSLGPYLVTRDELKTNRIKTTPLESKKGERYDLSMKAFHNGKQVSEGNLKDMSWTFAQIIERASYGVTLHPGEVIGSGTVGTGCYLELNSTTLKDQPVWLKPGDHFALEVENLGRLENTIRQAFY